jgi:hypothetical protein
MHRGVFCDVLEMQKKAKCTPRVYIQTFKNALDAERNGKMRRSRLLLGIMISFRRDY